jgi:hypothetical protein
MRFLALLAIWAAAGAAQSPFRFRDISPESVELSERGQPVYVYNHGLIRKAGAPEDRARCCYLHPVYAPNGTILTDDFPSDHYHHRGIFWAWPIVTAGGERYDLWTLRGIRQRFVRWLARQAGEGEARLAVENAWVVEDRPLVKETVEIITLPAAGERRQIDFRLTFEASEGPVELRGEPAEDKGYGGFSVRFAPREKTVITTDAGAERQDSNMAPHPWAQLEALFAGRRAGLRIDIDPANPDFPNGWCLRHYGFLGVNFPGLKAHRLQPGRPLLLRYKVTVFP